MPRMTTLIVTNVSFTHVTVEATSIFGFAIMELPLSLNEFKQGMAKWDAGEYVQNAFPTLNATQREFLMTGLSEANQQKLFCEEVIDSLI